MSHSQDETTADELTSSDRRNLLAARRRRLVLEVLETAGTAVHLDELAPAVAEHLDHTAASEEATVNRIAVALHHVHLPKLAAADVLEYDHDTHRVVPDSTAVETLTH